MSYWNRLLARVLRLQAGSIEQGRMQGGERPTDSIAELRARADDIDPGEDIPPATTGRPVTMGEWLRGIREIDGDTPLALPWVQPAGAHDVVRLGEYRSHGGVNWRSLIDYNTTEPGSDDRWWTQEDPALDVEDDLEPVPDWPDWAPGIAVLADERYVFDGRVYRVIQRHTTQAHWPPPVVPALFADEGPAP